MEDTTIIDLYWARNQGAIAASDEKYGHLCRGLSMNILASHEDAEECVNDTWYRAWDTMPPQRPGSLRAYLCKIVRNLSIDRWRAKRAQKRGEGMEVLLDELDDCLPDACSTEETVQARELGGYIDRWLDTLPQQDRLLFVRRYWYGVRVDELAREWSDTPGQMAQRLYRLRVALRKLLEREGVMV